MKNLQVTVGIPAYNEEKNIGKLVRLILSQKEVGFKLSEVLIISDGSTDLTAQIVKSIKDRRVKFYDDGQRMSQQARQNQMIAKFKGDILVIVEADTVPYDCWTLAKLVKPYHDCDNSRIGMVVGRDIMETPRTFFEKVFRTENEIKQNAFEKFRGGDNLYNCSGHTMRAIARSFSRKLFFPSDVPEDCYCYLRLKELGFLMVKANDARVLAKNISTTEDRQAHSDKFYLGKSALSQYFDKQYIDIEYRFPRILLLKQLFLSFFKSPIFTILAVLEFAVNFSRYVTFNLRTNSQNLTIFERE